MKGVVKRNKLRKSSKLIHFLEKPNVLKDVFLLVALNIFPITLGAYLMEKQFFDSLIADQIFILGSLILYFVFEVILFLLICKEDKLVENKKQMIDDFLATLD